MAKTYSASMLKVLEGLDAVRMRPGMYIGSTGSRGLHHLLWEIVDNAIDEVANGYARSISVELHKDGSASVEDDGRGVPVAVSYTHLDVYKRQLRMSLCPNTRETITPVEMLPSR